jgi:hypothetical protein
MFLKCMGYKTELLHLNMIPSRKFHLERLNQDLSRTGLAGKDCKLIVQSCFERFLMHKNCKMKHWPLQLRKTLVDNNQKPQKVPSLNNAVLLDNSSMFLALIEADTCQLGRKNTDYCL